MRSLRSFSTTTSSLRQYQKQQSVAPSRYNPFVKARWKKFYMKELNYNKTFTPDFWFLLQALQPTEEQLVERRWLQEKLHNIIQAHFGRNFEVQYVGLASYASANREEPCEFAIVDTNVEQGVAGSQYLENLPTAYDPVQVSNALLKEGFDGIINNPGFAPVADLSFNWPMYHRIRRREVLYPVRLRAHHPVAFDLLLPGPSVMPLVGLLSAYCKITKGVSEMITLLFLWFRSFGMDQIPPACIALLFIRFFQENCEFPCLTSSDDKWNGQRYNTVVAAGNTGRWALHQHRLQSGQSGPHESEWEMEQVLLETAFVNDPMLFNEAPSFNPAVILDKFMEFWSQGSGNAWNFVVSVNSGNQVQRTFPYIADGSADLEVLECECKERYDQGTQPPSWKIHPLVVQNPFVYTHNHAEWVSQATIDHLYKQASIVQKAIQSGHPLSSIFGPDLDLSSIRSVHNNLIKKLQISYPAEIAQSLSPYIFRARSYTVRRVEDAVKKSFGVHYRVEVFGSTVYGLDNPTSDLDLVVIDPNRMDGFPANVNLKRLPLIYNVRQMGKELRKAGFFNVVCIPNASVPIVKFKDPQTDIECDLNVNDQLGSLNTAMIKQYLDLQPILRPLLRTIKIWAKSIGLNSPSGSRIISFSSYALTLMTIGFFQVKGWLPNLQDLDSQAERTFFWTKTRQGKRHQCDASFSKVAFWPLVDIRLEAILLQWFAYWGEEFQYDTDLVCIRRGGVVQRKNRFVHIPKAQDRHKDALLATPAKEVDSRNTPTEGAELDFLQTEVEDILEQSEILSPDPKEWTRNPLVVADPFILPKNCCSQILLKTITEFKHECRGGEMFLEAGGSIRDFISNAVQRTPKVEVERRQKNKGRGAKRTETAVQAGRGADGRTTPEEALTKKGRKNKRPDAHTPVAEAVTSVVPPSPPSIKRATPGCSQEAEVIAQNG